MKKQYFIFASILILSIFLVFHTTVILLKVMPLNPISVKVKPFAESYGKPLFNQNWHLFAPTPIMTNNNIYMQVSLRDKQTEWLDISTELKKIGLCSILQITVCLLLIINK
ncbi:DUF5819 family protein, partial [Providencia sp. NPDC089923]|uniref:DUF5819 family protein n=1 Tax=Providencia sp. NPDC089923 TaxID=3415004 RepID=UPI003C30C579